MCQGMRIQYWKLKKRQNYKKTQSKGGREAQSHGVLWRLDLDIFDMTFAVLPQIINARGEINLDLDVNHL